MVSRERGSGRAEYAVGAAQQSELDRATGQGQEVGSEGGGEKGEAQPGLAILNVELVPPKFKHRILNAL